MSVSSCFIWEIRDYDDKTGYEKPPDAPTIGCDEVVKTSVAKRRATVAPKGEDSMRSSAVAGLCVVAVVCLSSFAAVTSTDETVVVDSCDTPAFWTSSGEPYGSVEIKAGPFGRKEGWGCIRLKFSNGPSYARLAPVESWADNDYLTFWLRVVGPGKASRNLILDADSEEEGGRVFKIYAKVSLDFEGWRRVRLAREDFTFEIKRHDSPVDWSMIRGWTFGLDTGEGKPTIFIDNVRYGKSQEVVKAAIAEKILVSSCDTTDGWSAEGIAIAADPKTAVEGTAALKIHYAGVTRGRVAIKLTAPIGSNHAFVMFLRGPGMDTKATFAVEAITPSGGRFLADVDVVNFEIEEHLLLPGRFRKKPGPDGVAPRWEDIMEIAFVVRCDTATNDGNIIIDNARFEHIAPRKTRAVPDKKFWWWDGGFDPFCTMHAAYADWPHLESDKRPGGDGKPAVVKFSENILAPLVPYRIHIHNDGGFRGFRIAITDWEMNALDEIVIENAAEGVTECDLIAPPRAGTVMFNVECIDKAGKVARTYQTGLAVLAKRLAEPEGVWGLHTYVGSKGDNWPHHDQVLRLFKATGVMVIRERIAFAGYESPYDMPARQKGAQGNVLRIARELGLRTLVIACQDNAPHLWVKGIRRLGIAPGKEAQVVKTAAEMAEIWDGLVDWWECGNEGNHGDATGTLDVLDAMAKGFRQTDPDARVMMGGAHILNVPRAWQLQAWDREKKTGHKNQDALATHLYPPPSSIEDTLRAWVASLGDALMEKGMLMTEGGHLTIPNRTETLLRQGRLPEGYSGERVSQYWYMRYAPVILGEHLRMGAKLHGVCFFRSTPSMGDWIFNKDESNPSIRVSSHGHFVARWNSRQITMPRPMAYTHNTIARLLTHDVKATKVEVVYDKSTGRVENYAFRRPGETVVALWVGVSVGSRAEKMEAMIEMPEAAGLALLADMDGNERVVVPEDGLVTVTLEKGQARYLRLLDGIMVDGVFVQNAAAAAADAKVIAGTPFSEPRIAAEISRDRDLPAISDVVPMPERPMVLHSKERGVSYVVGQTDADVARAMKVRDEREAVYPQ